MKPSDTIRRRISDADQHTLHQLAAFTSTTQHRNTHLIHVANGWAWASDAATYASLPIELDTPEATLTIDPLEVATGQVTLTCVDMGNSVPASAYLPIGPNQTVLVPNPTRVAYDLAGTRTKARSSNNPDCVGAVLPGWIGYSAQPVIVAPPATRVLLDVAPFLSAVALNVDLLARALRVWTDPVNLGIPAVSGQPVTVWPADTHGEDGFVAVMPMRTPILDVIGNSDPTGWVAALLEGKLSSTQDPT